MYISGVFCCRQIVPGGFEPPSQAPKAFRLDRYPTGLPPKSNSHKIYIAFPGVLKE